VTTTTTTTAAPTTNTTLGSVSGCFVDHGDSTIVDTCTGLQWEKKDTAVGSGRNAADLHDVDNLYSWAGCCDGNCDHPCQPNAAAAATCAAQAEDGTQDCSTCAGTCDLDTAGIGTLTTVWDWLNLVNSEGLAGHSDWRLPSESGCNTCYSGDPSYGCSSCSAHDLETILLSAYPCGPQPCISPIFGPTASNIYWSSTSDAPTPTRAWCVNFFRGYAGNLPKTNGLFVRAVRDGS
jgi:hypothetical protein